MTTRLSNCTVAAQRVRLFLGARGSCSLVVALMVAAAVASTTGIGLGDSWFDEQRITLLLAIAAAAVASRLLRPERIGPLGLYLLAVPLAGLLSSALSNRPYVAAVDWSAYCLMALLIVHSTTDVETSVSKTTALLASVLPSAYVMGVMANYFAAVLLSFPVGADTLLVGFANPRFPAQLQVLTIPLLPLAMQKAPTRFWRACLFVVAALWWMCFIGSGSRTGWIAVAAAAFVVAVLGGEGRTWLRWQVLFAASGAVLWLVLFDLLPAALSVSSTPETGRFSNFASVGARWELWRLSLAAALAHPLLGLGPMHFAYVENRLGAHPHNFWLQLAAEWGIPAMLLILYATLALVVGLWRRLKKEQDPSSRSIGVALFAAVIAWGVGTLSDGYMVIPTSQAMSTAVLMLAVMWLRLGQPAPARPSPRVDRIAAIASTALLAVALGVLAALPFTEFGQPTKREQAWRAEHPGHMMWPRFWQQGWIGPDNDPTARPQGLSPTSSK